MLIRRNMLLATAASLGLAGVAIVAHVAGASDAPSHRVKPAQHGGTVVTLCDGETSYEMNVKPGQEVPLSEAKQAAETLMEEWRRKNPNQTWEAAPALLAQNSPAPQPVRPGGENASSGSRQVNEEKPANIQAGDTYGDFSGRDRKIWAASTEAFVEEGNRIFHDTKKLGGTTGMACDMCHPNAANTHPETYPKYQVQLGRVALVRDMINWCIENPVRGKPLPDDDGRLRALEAYIYAQRRGVPLEYGKH
jgi:thiosulfate dehydrogenase